MATKKPAKSKSLFDAVDISVVIAAGAAGIALLPAQFEPLFNQGLIEVHPEADAEGKHLVRANATALASNKVGIVENPAFFIAADVPVPAISGRGRASAASAYPFDNLAVGHSFFVANTEDRPDAAKSLASTVSAAKARYAVETGEMKSVVVKVYAKDADGKIVKNADGSRVVTGEVTETRAVTRQERDFVLRAVEDGAPWGQAGVAGAAIWRTL